CGSGDVLARQRRRARGAGRAAARPRRGDDAAGVAVLRPLPVQPARRMARAAADGDAAAGLRHRRDPARRQRGRSRPCDRRAGRVWTELMPDFARDQHALYPRVAALAELGWSPAAAHDWHGFLQRLPAELARYRALGIDYADTAFAPAFDVTAGAGDTLRVALANQT